MGMLTAEQWRSLAAMHREMEEIRDHEEVS